MIKQFADTVPWVFLNFLDGRTPDRAYFEPPPIRMAA
jgi:hypothetical protein